MQQLDMTSALQIVENILMQVKLGRQESEVLFQAWEGIKKQVDKKKPISVQNPTTR